MEHENFGAHLEKNNNWLDDDLAAIAGKTTDKLEKAKLIFSYVRDHFTCTQRSGLYTSAGLKEIWKAKSGNVADINLMLIAMLKHDKIECYPIILSTRSHGITNPIYPLLDRFNYVICVALIGEQEVMLDASVPYMAFGRIDRSCYNGHARVLTSDPIPIMLTSDSITERSLTMAIIVPEGNQFKGRITSNPGYFESLGERGLIKEKGEAVYTERLRSSYGSDVTISNTSFEALKEPEDQLKISYDITFKENDEDILYLNPVLTPFYKENPFSAAKRLYPVEMPYRIDKTLIFNFTIPAGYVVDELPKSTKVFFNEDEGFFEYIINNQDGLVQLRTKFVLKRANFAPEEYESLRDFFGYIIKKQAEQIVLKKK